MLGQLLKQNYHQLARISSLLLLITHCSLEEWCSVFLCAAVGSLINLDFFHCIFQENVKISHSDDIDVPTPGLTLENSGLIQFDQVTARYPLRIDLILKKAQYMY